MQAASSSSSATELRAHDWNPATLGALEIVLHTSSGPGRRPLLAAIDADGTLWDHDLIQEFWVETTQLNPDDTAAQGGLDYLNEVLARWEGRGGDVPRSMADVAHLAEVLTPDVVGCCEMFYRYMQRFGDADAQARVLDAFFAKDPPEKWQRPQIVALMRALHARGWHIAVVSASPKRLVERALKRGGMSEYVRDVIAGLEERQDVYPAFIGKVKLTDAICSQRPSLVIGDSFGDFPLLQSITEGGVSVLLLNKENEAMREIAQKSGWFVQSTSGWKS